jgi:hypothetical protein
MTITKTSKKINKKTNNKRKSRKSRKSRKNKKGGYVDNKRNCSNYSRMIDTIKSNSPNSPNGTISFGTGKPLIKVQAANLTMFPYPDNRCYRSKTVSEYISWLFSNGFRPGTDGFKTPGGAVITKEYLDAHGINELTYDKSINIPKELKNAFNIVTPDTDYRTETEKNKQDKIICKLLDSNTLYKFLTDIIFKLIKKLSKVATNNPLWNKTVTYLGSGMPEWKKWLLQNINTHYFNNGTNEDMNVILKPGYRCSSGGDNCLELVDFVLNSEDTPNNLMIFYETYNKNKGVTFLQLMGVLYRFPNDATFIRCLIDDDTDLQIEFMNGIKLFFGVPDNMSYETFKTDIIDKSYNPWFYPWAFTFLANRKNNLVHQIKSAMDEDYLRRKVEKTADPRLYTTYKKKPDIDSCKNRQFEIYANSDLKLVSGNTYQAPRDNGVWFNTMKKYYKEIISGPSGSTVYVYQNIFNLSKIIEQNEYNKVLLLLCIILDYYNLYHGISEILQVYTEESTLQPKYKLDMDDSEYISQLIFKLPLKTIKGLNCLDLYMLEQLKKNHSFTIDQTKVGLIENFCNTVNFTDDQAGNKRLVDEKLAEITATA